MVRRLAWLFAAALLTACATPERTGDPQSCPTGEIQVCTGGQVERGRISRREPRVCECQPADSIS